MMEAPTWERLVREATVRRIKLSTAESCTGGRISSLITDVPGASKCFLGGFVVYSNDLKERILRVSHKTLSDHGAVSKVTAEEMVRGCIGSTGADISLAVTGIAGPTGGTLEKPVGTVHISVLVRGGEPHSEGFLIDCRDRIDFKEKVAEKALGMLLGAVLGRRPEKS